MKQFLRYIFTLAAMLMMVVGNAWAEWPKYEGTIKNVNGTYYVIYDTDKHSIDSEWGGETYTYNMAGPGASISFDAMRERWEAIGNLTVNEYQDETLKKTLYQGNPDAKDYSWGTAKEYNSFGPYNLSNTYSNKIKFIAGPSGSYDKKFTNVKVPMLQYVGVPSISSWNAKEAILGSANETTTTKFDWSNTSALTYSISGDASQFICTITNNASAGKYGTATITISYKHDKVGTHTATLKLSNGKSINLSGTTLDKYTATFQWGLANTYLIDEWGNLVDIYSLTDKDGKDIKSQFHNSITFSSSDQNVVSIENGKIIAKNAGQATITAYFAGNNEWHGFTKTIVLTINKHTPVFTWNGKSVNVDQSVLYNTHYDNYFQSSSTKNLENMQFTYSSSNTDVATLSAGDAARSLDLTVYNKPSTITLTASQTENWYWYAKTETHTITPKHKDNHVPFTIDSENKMSIVFHHSHNKDLYWDNGINLRNTDDIGFDWEDNYIILEFSGIPDKLFFSTATQTGATDVKFIVSEGKSHDNLTEIYNKDKTESNVTLKLNPETRYIKLCYSGNLNGYFRGTDSYKGGVSVTELNEFYAVETSDEETKTEIEHLYFNEEGKPNQIHATTTRTFDIKYANAGYKVTAISNDNHFTVTPATTNQIGGEKHGLYTFTVNYTAREPYSTTDNNSYITLTDELGHKDIVYLHASSDKFYQTLRWKEEIAAVGEDKPYVVRKTVGEIINAAIASSDLTITYESTNKEVIKVEGTKLILVGPGETTITAKQNGNDLYYPADSISKQFVVTDKLLQYIIWNDAPTDIIKTDGTQQITLTAQVYVQTEDENNPFVLSPERTKALTYKSANTNIISVAGNILTVGNIGKTTLTAQVPETEE